MKHLQKYWPILLILLAFLSGRWTASKDTGELEKLREDRKVIIQGIINKQVEVTQLRAAQEETERKRVSDSLYYANALQTNKRAYTALKKKYNEINLNRADAHTLDSLLFSLYPN